MAPKKPAEPKTYSLDSTPLHPAHQHISSLDTLQQDMVEALEHDQKKKQVNDAKLRAVKQRVEYDDFEKLVQGAHLKPIKPRSDTLKEVGQQFDGFVMPKFEPGAATAQPKPSLTDTASAAPTAPKSSNEFLRVWRRQCKTPEQRYAYLRQIDPETLPLLFRTELDAALFDGIACTISERIVALGSGDESRAAEERGWAGALLRSIPRINRFDLTLDFADKATVTALAKTFDTLNSAVSSSADAMVPPMDAAALASLRTTYKV